MGCQEGDYVEFNRLQKNAVQKSCICLFLHFLGHSVFMTYFSPLIKLLLSCRDRPLCTKKIKRAAN